MSYAGLSRGASSGHGVAWGLARSVSVYPAAWVPVIIIYIIATLLGSLVPIFLSDLYFARDENTYKKKYYLLLPVVSLPLCVLMSTVFAVDPESEHIKQQQKQFIHRDY
jgi:hypothetical protein